MNLDTIHLPGAVVAELFKNSLVMGEMPAKKTAPSHLGYNRKNIVFIVEEPDLVFLPDMHLSFITKMLEACRMNMEDIALLNHAHTPVNIHALRKQLAPKILVLFGPAPPDILLPFNIPLFKVQSFDGCSYLYAPSLDKLNQEGEEGKLLKSKLWVCLRTLFGV